MNIRSLYQRSMPSPVGAVTSGRFPVVFTLDPPMTDELCTSARYPGIPQLERLSSFHALNQKASARKVSAKIGKRIAAGDRKAAEVFEAVIYHVAKEAGACAAVLEGEIDAIVFTGSLVYSDILMESLKRKISFIAPIHLIPGENEMTALAGGVMRYFNGAEDLSVYS